MKFFTLYWQDGSKNFIHGETFEDAVNAAGYGHRTIVGLMDHYQRGFDYTYVWVPEIKNWQKNMIVPHNVDLYEIVVGSAKFDKQVTEGFLLDTFGANGIWYHQNMYGKLMVHVSDLEKIFKLKLEA